MTEPALTQSHLLCKTKLARGKFGTRVQSCTHHERLRKLENDSSRPGIAQSTALFTCPVSYLLAHGRTLEKCDFSVRICIEYMSR